ncbi:DUF3289 family protein [Cronobacter malonaticus]|uniref:DUF3289 domain-containing protein n=4 Tax=Cronobacter malonaticus TaxID=413503 RepID=V5TV05_9ENTR|nr:DUF3289 family protein [Cronobacter malonaticus]CCJ92792.1 FIG00553621: hypothetical protein [Cronobacter malonaticus 681]AHB68973.1 hypothetical protein P262_00860 [Cronobacter malonaticus]ALX77246.1 hypothetical protein AFK66_020600 [Cronobacter malonaticus LMG 23826]EGT4288294.1 DUF3289 family protein [Cronobacter malonaticus]EGT4315148.1 DUF3289 family protein [Cronobacter malonaticus]
MHISPPILFPRKDDEDYASWVMRTMPVDPARGFPVNGVESWHGGIHIPHTDSGVFANPLRAVADGVVVWASYPASPEKRGTKPLNYEGATDNGCVLIRHEMLIGEIPETCVFYSLTMHMKQVRPEILSKSGINVRRGPVIGTTGMVGGRNAYHFQMCCSAEMLKVICGRDRGFLDLSASGRVKSRYGNRYFYFPAETPVYNGNSPYELSLFPFCHTSLDLYIVHEGLKTRTMRKVDWGYELVGETAIAVDCICEPTPVVRGYEIYSEWVKVIYPGGEGWVDVSSPKIKTWTDADFPDWAGWILVDDDLTPDSQCNSKIVKKAREKRCADFTRFICKFPLEWDFSSFDARFSWLKNPNASLSEPMNDESYTALKEYVKALSFFEKLPMSIQNELAGQVWHFDPRGLIIQLQKAERRLIYSSANSIKHKKMNDFTVDDMQHGDLTKEQILEQGKVNKINISGKELKKSFFNFDKTLEEHFATMDNMAEWTAWGEYSPLIRIMLEKFKRNEGGILRHELLNKAFLEHKTTKLCVDEIKRQISDKLNKNNFKALSGLDLEGLSNDIGSRIKLPKFDDYDWVNGLGIAIHDTYSTNIYIDELDVFDANVGMPNRVTFKARISFCIQDHFGLDTADMNGKGFELIPWFCSWFILQRYQHYDFKPFINEADFSIWIEGD